ncbi:MAG: hypothetical protein ACM37W_22945 [Actinomycetota bacterium]
MTEILAKTQASMQDTMGSPIVNPHSATASSKGFQQFPYSSSTSTETIAELEKQATDLRTSYRSVSEALFEFGDKLLSLKETVKQAGEKWSKWAKHHFPDMDKQVSDAMAIARIWRQLWEDEYQLIEKMKGWRTPQQPTYQSTAFHSLPLLFLSSRRETASASCRVGVSPFASCCNRVAWISEDCSNKVWYLRTFSLKSLFVWLSKCSNPAINTIRTIDARVWLGSRACLKSLSLKPPISKVTVNRSRLFLLGIFPA